MILDKKLLEIEHKIHRVSFSAPETGVDYHWSYENISTKHEHDFYEFVIITSGKIRHIHNRTDQIVSKGSFFIIKPNEYHQFFPVDNIAAKQICFSITPTTLEQITSAIWQHDVIKMLSQDLPYLYLPKKIKTNLFNLIDRINQSHSSSKNIPIIIKTAIIELLSYLIDNIEPTEFLTYEKTPPAWLTEFLQQLNDPAVFTLQLKDIYRLAPYSQSMLNIYFNKYFNSTLISYITKLKMNYACNLLQYTDDTPLDICYKLNYDSLSHFCKIFKRFTGKTPIAYKKSTL